MLGRTKRRLRLARLSASCAAFALVVSGCATKPTVVSDCPIPNVDEQNDLEMFLNWEPDRPAALYMARVLGQVYGLELEEQRNGADPE